MSTATDGCGTIFRITLPTGTFSTLHAFKDDKSEGCNPRVTLVQHTNGILYGDTHAGGSGGSGVFFSLKENLRRFVTLLPYSGKVGATIEFLGQGFTSISAVSFDGTPASRTMVSGTFLTATVPSGAGTGLVTVTTSGGTLKSNKIFRVIPQITSFSPTSGPVGTSVTITGVSLKQTTKVTFGGVKATGFTVFSDTKVTAVVPSGAVTGKIAITTPGGTAVSSGIFTVSISFGLSGNCDVDPSSNTLTGYCSAMVSLHCQTAHQPTQCPPGQLAIQPQQVQCGVFGRPYVDTATRCNPF
jgi:uncharacterized repeat protein (TIGR03803 family)